MSGPSLLFDLDGTLVDTAPDLLGALNAVLASEGRAAIDPQTLRHMVGHGARVLIERAMAATGEPVSPLSRFVRLIRALMAACFRMRAAISIVLSSRKTRRHQSATQRSATLAALLRMRGVSSAGQRSSKTTMRRASII